MKIKNLIQIAGIIDKEEAQLLVEFGVDLLGFPLRLTIHKEDISEHEAANIIYSLYPPQYGVLITYMNIAKEIHAFCQRLSASIVQLHGEITLRELSELDTIAPELKIIKSLIVRENNISELRTTINEASPYVDAFITDTFDPVTGASGATGKTHEWNISRELVEFSPKPVILAGGLNPNNVRKAIFKVRPAGVDTHTGVEDKNGRKNRDLVKSFISEAREAFDLL